MNTLELTVQDIKDLMETFRCSGLGTLVLEQGDFRLKLESAAAAPATAASSVQAVAVAAADATPATQAPPAPRGHIVTAPIVGTYYASPSPEKPPFVSVGDHVKKGDVLFILESMKLMNEVTSDYDGTVAEIFVCNAQGVEYGQPILRIE